MRIVDDDDESAGEEEEEEMEEEEDDAEVVRLPSLTARLFSDYSPSDRQKQTNWSPTRNRRLRFLLHQRSKSSSSFLNLRCRWRHLVVLREV